MARERAFRGASTHSLDDKARLIVPKRFLERLPAIEADFVLTASPDGCLLLLDRQSFEDLTRDIGGSVLEQDARPRDLRRLLLGHAEDVRPDKAGRILIPEALRQYLGLGKEDREVVVVGGVVNILGTMAGAVMIGFLQKSIEWANPSNTLAAQTYMIIFIIIFIQFRPRGIIALKGRAAGD